jgi:hypothetical protein
VKVLVEREKLELELAVKVLVDKTEGGTKGRK